jgi:general secretion pathway protein D
MTRLPFLLMLTAAVPLAAQTGSTSAIPATASASFPLRHTSAVSVVALAQAVTGVERERAPFSSSIVGGGSDPISSDVRTNSIIVRGTADDIAKIRKLIDEVDVARPPSTAIFPLQHITAANAATTIRTLLQTAQQSGNSSPISSNLQVTSDGRTNSVIVRGSPLEIAEIKNIIDSLDRATPQIRTRFFRVQNASAAEVTQEIRRRLVQEATETLIQQIADPTAVGANREPATGRPALTRNSPATKRDERLSTFSAYLAFTSDARTNSILVTGTEEDITRFGKLIEETAALHSRP